MCISSYTYIQRTRFYLPVAISNSPHPSQTNTPCIQVFYEEELDVPLVLFDEVLEHVLRIDRIFRQPQGHLLLIGVSGAGKTTLSRFVAWMNGLHVYQIKVHNKYSMEDFDEDLRTVLRRSGWCSILVHEHFMIKTRTNSSRRTSPLW